MRAARWSFGEEGGTTTGYHLQTLRVGELASLKGLYNPAQGWPAAGQKGGGPTLGSAVKMASTL